MLLENHWQEDKFQSCEEIECNISFEVSVMKKMSINLDIFFYKNL